jgi:hypothetical protein
MAHKRRLLGRRVAQALLMALLVTQGVLVVNACTLPATGMVMPYADTGMSGTCVGMSKNACLIAYLQADQASGSAAAHMVGFEGTAIPAVLPIAASRDFPGIVRPLQAPPSTAPPPHVLFCRMLR